MDDQEKKERPSYYYSYGPFKSGTTSISESGEASDVEVSAPKTRTSFETEDSKARINWAYPPKKKSTFRSVFASFMAGAIIMGSFMFASDKMNLFTSNEVAAPVQLPAANETIFSNNNTGNTSSSNAALTIVRPDTIADIVKNSSPAVVKIETIVSQGSTGGRLNDQFFRDFFGDSFRENPNQGRRVGGVGSGFIFEKNGYILTNQHVLSNAEEIYVTLLGYTEPFKAELLGSDYDLDLAVIKITGENDFPTLPLGNSSDLRVGEWVTAIGNPVGFDHTVSVGVISANEREIQIPDEQGPRRYKHLLQTDASINPGNSGGPLLNLNGEVIGINTAVSIQAQGIGFAIPTSTIVEVLENLKNNVDIPKPYIGVYLADIDQVWKENLKLESIEGSLVTQLERNGPASRAGLRPGDVIVKVNDTEIKNTEQLIKRIGETTVGQNVLIEIIREGKVIEAAVIIGNRSAQ